MRSMDGHRGMDTGARESRVCASAFSTKPGLRPQADEAGPAGKHARAFRAFARRLERNWPLSAAIILLAIVALSFFKSG